MPVLPMTPFHSYLYPSLDSSKRINSFTFIPQIPFCNLHNPEIFPGEQFLSFVIPAKRPGASRGARAGIQKPRSSMPPWPTPSWSPDQCYALSGMTGVWVLHTIRNRNGARVQGN